MPHLSKMNVRTRLGTLLVFVCMAGALVYIWSRPMFSSQITPVFRMKYLENPFPPPHPPQGNSTRLANHTQKPTHIVLHGQALPTPMPQDINAQKPTNSKAVLHNQTLQTPMPPGTNDQKPTKTKCAPRKHVLFLKTHKCASSTVQNILYRFGMKNKLDFVLPSSGYYISKTREVDTKSLLSATDGQYDVITNHAVLSESLIKLLPADAIKITAVRDPATHFRSVYDYYRIGSYVGLPEGKAGVEMFMANTTKYYFEHSPQPPYIHNLMLKDLGFPDRNSENKTAVVQYINWLNKVFDLVILTEYFPESVVLMRDLLCWKDEEVISTILNKRPKAFSVESSTVDKMYAFNWQDKLLYDHFTVKLIKRIDEYGKENMAQEVDRLDKLTQTWIVECGIKEVISSSETKLPTYLNRATTFEVKPEKWTNTSCVYLIMPELKFHDFLKLIQLTREKNSTDN